MSVVVSVETESMLRWEETRLVRVRNDLPHDEQIRRVDAYDVTPYDNHLIYRVPPRHLVRPSTEVQEVKFRFIPRVSQEDRDLYGVRLFKRMKESGFRAPTSSESLAFAHSVRNVWWEGCIRCFGSVWFNSQGDSQILSLRKYRGNLYIEFHPFGEPLEEDDHLLAINVRY